MALSIGELFISLGFDVDDKKLKEFTAGIKEVRNDLLKMSAVATGAVYALNAFIQGSAQNATALKNFTQQTGYSAEALQKWQAVIHATNPAIGLDEALTKYKAFTEYLGRAKRGEGAGALAMLGVNYDPNATPEQELEQIRRNIQATVKRYGVQMTSQLLEETGIGAGALPALLLSRQQFEDEGAKYVWSPQERKNLEEYSKALAQLDLEWNKFKADLGAAIAPSLVAGTKDFAASIKALIDGWKDFPAASKWVVEGFAIIGASLVIISTPLALTGAALTVIAAALWDIGRAARGLPSVTGSVAESLGKDWSDLTNPGYQIGAHEQVVSRRAKGKQWNISRGNALTYFQKMGWSPQQAAGIVANLDTESGFNPGAVGDNGQAFGLAQWHPDRQANFKAWSGKDIRESSFIDQLKFVHYELTQGGERAAGERLHRARSAGDAGAIMSRYYERPANAAAEASARGQLAENIAKQPISIVQNNTLHVHGSGNAQDTADATDRTLKRQLGLASAALNLGPTQ